MSPDQESFKTRAFRVQAKKVKGPYPAQKHRAEEEEEPRRSRVPKARRPIPLEERSSPTKLMDAKKGAGEPPGDPVRFYVYERTGKTGPMDENKGSLDVSGADSESGVVLLSGNWFCHYSTDGGATFTSADPTTVFPGWAAHSFCCDQIVVYVREIDRFVWFMQHGADSKGIGAFRVAVASPAAIKKKFTSAWTYWDFTASTFGLSEDMDYPDLSFTNEFLHVSTDAPTTNGRLVARFALSDLAKGGTLPGRHTFPSDATNAVGAHLVQGSADAGIWTGQPNNSSFQVYSWPDSSTTYARFKVGVAAWPNGTLSSKAPNGNDWLSFLSGHVPQYEACGAARRGDELWLAWTAASGTGTSGGFSFPNAHVRVAIIDLSTRKLVSESQVWNKAYAFAYPSLGVNGSQGEVGIAVAVGGSKNHAHTSVGILGDLVVWHLDEGDYTPKRWGDYITVRQHERNRSKFAGFGYFMTKDPMDTKAGYANPFYVVYGRKSLGP